MDTEHETGPGEPQSRLHPALAAAMDAERSRPPEITEAERSMLATHHDPTLASHDPAVPETETPEAAKAAAAPEGQARTQVRWVRPTDLAMQGGARATGWGLDLRTELERRLAHARTQRQERRTEARSERAQRLPDLSINGRRRNRRPELERSGMGLR